MYLISDFLLIYLLHWICLKNPNADLSISPIQSSQMSKFNFQTSKKNMTQTNKKFTYVKSSFNLLKREPAGGKAGSKDQRLVGQSGKHDKASVLC